MTKLCIFDLDGTLLDTLTSLWHCGNLALKEHGYEGLPRDLYRIMVGDGSAMLIRRMIENVHGKEEDWEKMLATYQEYFKEGCMYEVKPYPGICELLNTLKGYGIKLAVLSNKPHAQTERIIRDIFGREMFDMVLGQREGIPKKPSPEGVFEILRRLSVKEEEVLYLGDTDTDMKTGNAAHARTIGVLWGFREKEELLENGAQILAAEPMEVVNYL